MKSILTTIAKTTHCINIGYFLYIVLAVWCGKFSTNFNKGTNDSKRKKGRAIFRYENLRQS